MRVRRVIVTKAANVSDPDGLAHHANVAKCWRLPNDHVLFEFYHSVFDCIYDNDPCVTNAALQDEATRRLGNEAASIERGLLAPLYRIVKDTSDATMLLVPTRAALYLFLGRRKNEISWPDLGVSSGWESRKHVRIAGCLRRAKRSQSFPKLESVVTEWISSMAENGVLIERGPTATKDGYYFSINVRCTEPCGDALMALYMLVTLSPPETGLEKVGFFDEEDFNSEFLQIGGPRRTSQLYL